MTEQHRLLWIDMAVSVRDPEPVCGFEKLFRVYRYAQTSSIDAEIARLTPALICFDFDFPTKQGLKMLQEVKRCHASIPLIMMTVQHSEALAVWAFRSRVWDYLVKPIPSREVERCVCNLAAMFSLRSDQAAPRKPAIPSSAIPEENRMSGPRRGSLALAPAVRYVETNFSGKLSSAEAAALCHMTSFQFSRAFKEAYGLTFSDYVLRYRIREACRLLKHPAAQVADVAYLVGFSDPSYFGKVFRRYTNLTPSRFAEANQTVLDPERLLGAAEAE